MSLLEEALGYTKKGFRVLPLHSLRNIGGIYICTCKDGQICGKKPGKHPRTKHGVKDATQDENQIREWWLQWPDANIGIATGNGLIVVDIDPQNGGTIDTLGSLPDTAKVKTGSGGYHLYFTYDQAISFRNTAGTNLGIGIDTRAEGGYVLVPPSLHISGNRYEWMDKREPVPLPDHLLHKIHKDKPREIRKTERAVQNEEPKEQITEGGRNDYLTRIAGGLRAMSASVEATQEAIRVINQIDCDPPLEDKELEQTIFKSVNKWERGKREKPRGMTLAELEQMNIPDLQWVIPDILPEGITLLAGKPKIGKSWLALEMALNTALGGEILGDIELPEGDVLYLALEDTDRRMLDRSKKLLLNAPLPTNVKFYTEWRPLNHGGLEDLEEQLQENSKIRLVVIDTLAKVKPPTKGASTMYQEDYRALAPLKDLSEKYHIAVVLVTHMNKTRSNDILNQVYGSTGLTGVVDGIMVIEKERGDKNASLLITGRDVEEQKLSVVFDEDTGKWLKKESKTDEKTVRSKERQDILDLLREHPHMKPKDIAVYLGKNENSIYQLLKKMKDAGDIVEINGEYSFPLVTA